MKVMTLEEFKSEVVKKFGEDSYKWRFTCPNCQTEQSAEDLVNVGVVGYTVGGAIGFSCIGRFDEAQGCNWTLGGLFQIHELEVVTEDGISHPHFDIADKDANA